MPVTTNTKLHFIDTIFNNNALGNKLTNSQYYLGISWLDPYNYLHELSNPRNSSTPVGYAFFTLWHDTVTGATNRKSLGGTLVGPGIIDIGTGTGLNQGFKPSVTDNYAISNAVPPQNYRTAPGWWIITKDTTYQNWQTGSYASNNAAYLDSLLAAIPIDNASAWDNPGIYLRTGYEILSTQEEIIKLVWGTA